MTLMELIAFKDPRLRQSRIRCASISAWVVSSSGLWISHTHEIPLDVIAGKFTTRVKLHVPPQVQLDLTEVRRYVPALGEHGLRLQLVVVGSEPVERYQGRVCGRCEVAVQSRNVSEAADAEVSTSRR